MMADLKKKWAMLVILGLLAACKDSQDPAEQTEASPLVFKTGYPHAFFFRSSETEAANLTYEKWERMFLPLDGMMGKVFQEEAYNRNNQMDYFRKFKERYPDKAVFVHMNGYGRQPRFDTEGFFAGHWLYRAGTHLTKPVAAGETVLHVKDTSMFQTEYGKRRELHDDIGLAMVGTDGKPDWMRAEQVRLVSVNAAKKTITVQRGSYGTVPLAFSEGAYVAPHVVKGPYTKEGDFVWFYNFSTSSPRDAKGRNAADALIDDLALKFGTGGIAQSFDGLQFDMLRFHANTSSGMDADNDGVQDDGIINGINVYGTGVTQFLDKLKKRLPDKLILADDKEWPEGNRGFNQLNGVESEGWPSLFGYDVNAWSTGLNRYVFWANNTAGPQMNYINFKHKERIVENATFRSAPTDYAYARLVMAVSVFVDAAFTYGNYPGDGGMGIGIYDELWQGTDRKTHWLGKPVGPAVHLGERTPDLLKEQGIVGKGAAGLSGIALPGKDLLVTVRLKADPLAGYPSSIGRGIHLSAVSQHSNKTAIESFAWANQKEYKATFYFADIGPGPVDLKVKAEGDEAVYLEGWTAHSATDAMYREFEHGVVFANPSNRSYTFDLAKLFPGMELQRLNGSKDQDPATNNGSLLSNTLTLGPADGLFVRKLAR